MWFKSKKDINALKSLEPAWSGTKRVSKELSIRSFKMVYARDMRDKKYYCIIEYAEDGKMYGQGIEKEVRIDCDTWQELVGKVSTFLKEDKILP